VSKGRVFISVILILILGAVSFFAWHEWQEVKDLRQQCAKQVAHIQENEQSLMLIESWIKEDGYSSAGQWWEDYQKYQADYSHCDEKVINGENSDYVTEEQKNRLQEIAAEIKKSRSITEIKTLVEELNTIIEDIDKQKNAPILQEETPVINDNLIVDDYISDNNFIANDEDYVVPSSGLTQQSGVNYHDGRTETYYSSDVLYHYRTPEWTVDEEGFYRTDEGYYVVAASDMDQGATFEGSKGTCIVLDSGCSAGTTDYYVAWS